MHVWKERTNVIGSKILHRQLQYIHVYIHLANAITVKLEQTISSRTFNVDTVISRKRCAMLASSLLDTTPMVGRRASWRCFALLCVAIAAVTPNEALLGVTGSGSLLGAMEDGAEEDVASVAAAVVVADGEGQEEEEDDRLGVAAERELLAVKKSLNDQWC